MDLNYVYSVKRAAMGRQIMFCEQPTEMCDSVRPDAVEARQYVLRNPVHRLTQHAPRYSHCLVNTERAEYSCSGANHAEGGWPRDININDPEATQRYRRKLEKDDGYVRCIANLTPGLEHYIFQNNAIDMYQTYYSEFDELPKLEQMDCRTVNIFRDNPSSGDRRPVSSICWHPEGGQKLAVSYVNVDMDQNARSSVEAYIWDVENPIKPEMEIKPPCPLLDLQYNPKEGAVLAGALMNGQVAAWDTRTPLAPALLCPPHVAHRDAVRSVLFINAKSGMEFFSGGTDGAVKWWDIRNFNEPTDEIILDLVKLNESQSLSNAKGVSALEFECTIPTRYMLGTEDGLVITGNRKGKTLPEKLPGKFEAHVGVVRRVERNPSYPKNFLTVGDYTARVWSEDCRESAIMWTQQDRCCITDGAWSPTRPSLLMLCKWSGVLCMWDLLRRQHEPVLNMQVCDEALVYVRPHDAGALVASGSSAGSVFLLELSRNLVEAEPHDRLHLTALLDRESRRERILEARLREIRLKQRQAEEASPAPSLASLDAPPEDLHHLAADYFAQVKKEHAAL
nr:dynein intermediate chain 3, ciliary-like isoform X1 [Helicoverpa armigera]